MLVIPAVCITTSSNMAEVAEISRCSTTLAIVRSVIGLLVTVPQNAFRRIGAASIQIFLALVSLEADPIIEATNALDLQISICCIADHNISSSLRCRLVKSGRRLGNCSI